MIKNDDLIITVQLDLDVGVVVFYVLRSETDIRNIAEGMQLYYCKLSLCPILVPTANLQEINTARATFFFVFSICLLPARRKIEGYNSVGILDYYK